MRSFGLALALVAGGCLGDLVPLHQNSPQSTAGADAGEGGDGGAPGDLAPATGGAAADLAGAAAGDLGVACINTTAPLTDGHHNPGTNCMTCHNNANPVIPQFTIAGTLYSAATGGSAVAGATVEITDSAGLVLPIVSSTNGNFYSVQAVQFPVHARATACPANLFMQAAQVVGACNSCHTAGMQVHVP